MDAGLGTERQQIRDAGSMVVMPMSDKRIGHSTLFMRKDGRQSVGPGSLSLASIDQKSGAPGADEVGIGSLRS